MYLPNSFARHDVDELQRFMEEYAFGTLIVPKGLGESPEVSHLPFLVDRTRGELGTLRSHVARANPVWQAFDDRTPVVVVFHGPHGYVSPTWYTSRNQVPTWNYAVVHAEGIPRLVEPSGLRDLLGAMTDVYERERKDGWSVEELLPDKYDELSQAIVGFEITLARLEGKFKMSQNRKPPDRDGVIQGLQATGRPDDRTLAAFMERVAPPPRGTDETDDEPKAR
jgi:transcriptional regulator